MSKTISMYYASAPVFIRMLGNLRAILEKGAAHAAAKKFDPSVLLQGRLAPDMFALPRQVQIATDAVKGCMSRLAGEEVPKYEDKEATIPELIARIDKTIEHVKTFKPSQIDGTEEKAIVIKSPRGDLNFNGQQYLLHFVLPNLYFHVTTTYNILRHNGVEIGKLDYLGSS
ncbi:MAG: DUF1993 family protein [Pseudomonadota bacterium]